jgi:hypothetical protein
VALVTGRSGIRYAFNKSVSNHVAIDVLRSDADKFAEDGKGYFVDDMSKSHEKKQKTKYLDLGSANGYIARQP